MVKLTDVFPSRYLQAADLQGREVRVTIDRIGMEEMNDGKDKPVLSFKGKEKTLVLNKVNASTIADMYGDELDEWIGKGILLYPTRVDFQGKRVDAIRVKFVQPPPRSAGRGAPPQQDRQQHPSAEQQQRPGMQEFARGPSGPKYDERNPPPADHYPANAEFDDEIPF